MALHAARAIRRNKGSGESALLEMRPEQKKALMEAFEAADKNGDGILSADEYFEIFQSHGLTIGERERPTFLWNILLCCFPWSDITASYWDT